MDRNRAGQFVPTPHPSPVTYLARIEVGPSELPRLLENGMASKVAEALKEIGYAHVTLDLQGYRRGSLNQTNGARPIEKLAVKTEAATD